MNRLFTLALLAAANCSHSATSVDHAAPHGGRVARHGMVLFGKQHYFVEHIPMFSPPHDEQLIMRVSLRSSDGDPLTDDFSTAAHSLQPTAAISLDDLISGKRREFVADIHRGNFEAGGPLLHAKATIRVEAVVHARGLPSSETTPDRQHEYLLIGGPGDAYLTNRIRGDRPFQHIVRVSALDGASPALDSAQSIAIPTAERLATNSEHVSGAIRLVVAKELWCLVGPEFTEPCRR